MKRFISCYAVLLVTSWSSLAYAQKYELHPYAGGIIPGKFAGVVDMDNVGIYGLKAGVFVTSNIEAVANIGYVPQLNLGSSLTKKHAYIKEGLLAYNLRRLPAFYVSGGLGAVTAKDSQYFWGSAVSTSDTFFSFSYGGGLNVPRKWGPIGYRAEVRGRTIPSFYGFRLNMLETTAGLTFAWGER